MYQLLFRSFKVSLLAFSCFLATNSRVIAQVTSDSTVNTQVNQNQNIAEITGGETRGSNLFHSFQDFSVGTGNEAFFNNADSISNIFSRVTGGNISNIDGLIRANGNASLFLINPAGIIFGQNARLDIGGSFYSSTADSILFEDGEFSATDLDNPPVLTINAPIGLGFRDNPADITVRGDGNGIRTSDSEIIDTQDALRVDGDVTIGFIGGNLNFENATVKTAGGSIELGSVAGERVDVVEVANGFSFDYSGVEAFQDISLSGTTAIDASGNGGGDINIAGRNITLADVSQIEASTLGDKAGGVIDVFATGAINISGIENENNIVSAFVNQVYSNATADGGGINLETGSLTLGDRASITTSSSGQADAGNITINASDFVSLESQGNTSTIRSGINADAIGNSGQIDINSNSLTLANGASISSEVSGQGNAGVININANNLELLSNSNGRTSISSAVGSNVTGNAADININTNSFDAQGVENSVIIVSGNFNENGTESAGNINILSNNSLIADNTLIGTDNTGQGQGGNITIESTGNIETKNNSSFSSSGREGGSGNIEINTNSLTVESSPIAFFVGNTVGAGGNLTIDANENITFANNSGIFAVGAPGGQIDITAKNLSFLAGSGINAGTTFDLNSEVARAGDVVINLSEDLVLDGSDEVQTRFTRISNSSLSPGDAGDILITARNIDLKNGAEIGSLTNSQGNTGGIILNAFNNITIDGIGEITDGDTVINTSSEIATANRESGNAGKIELAAQNLSLTSSGQIISLVSGNGNSGDINLDISDTIVIDGFSNSILGVDSIEVDGNVISVTDGVISNSEIQSFVSPSGQGNSGDININTKNLFLSRSGSIDSNVSGQGNAGNINIDAQLITIGEPGDPTTSFSGIGSSAFTGFRPDTVSEANAGDININTKSLFISDGSGIDSNVSGFGNSGNITINASEEISISGTGTSIGIEIGDNGIPIIGSEVETEQSSGIFSVLLATSVGEGGNIEINTPKLSIADGRIISNTQGQGNAGAITINASEFIEIIDGNSDTPTAGIQAGALINNGNGGDVEIFTQDLTLRDGAIINIGNFPSSEDSTTLPGTGEAGSLTIEANSLNIEDGGRIDAATQAGNGGNISLDIAENITLRDSGFISARALQDANGGNIDIDTNFIVAFPQGNNDIIATAEQGNGGNININAQSLFGIQERPLNSSSNDINASSEFSLDGNVTISTPDINPVQGTTELPTNIVEPGETTQQACEDNREIAAKNSLTISGKGGIPAEPGLPLDSLNVTINNEANLTSTIPQPIETSQGKIQPARGIFVTESGEVILTAYRTNNAGKRILQSSRNCG